MNRRTPENAHPSLVHSPSSSRRHHGTSGRAASVSSAAGPLPRRSRAIFRQSSPLIR